MKFTAQQFQTERGRVQTEVFEDVKLRLSQGRMHGDFHMIAFLYICLTAGLSSAVFVLDLQLTSVDRPDKYEESTEAKEKARNEIGLVENQRAQKLTVARTNLMRARVSANKTIESANTAAAVKNKEAAAQAEIIYGRYQSQADLYYSVRQTRGLSSEALLAYIGTRLIDELGGITVGIDQPARVAYGTALNSTTRI